MIFRKLKITKIPFKMSTLETCGVLAAVALLSGIALVALHIYESRFPVESSLFQQRMDDDNAKAVAELSNILYPE